MNKRRIKTIISIVIVVFVLICLIPIPKHVEKDYYAVDTFSEEKAVISVDITYLNFLFLKDKMIGKIQVFDGGEIYTYETDSFFYQGQWPSNNQDKFMHAFGGFYYNPTVYWGKSAGIEGSQVIGSESVSAFMSLDFEKIVLYHREREELKEGQTRQDVGLESAQSRQYVGSTQKIETSEIIEYFKGFVREKEIEEASVQ